MQNKTVTWVVYLMTVHKRADKIRAICEQSEWDAMELTRPGYHQLVRGGIASETEAELLARNEPDAASAVAAARQALRRIVPTI